MGYGLYAYMIRKEAAAAALTGAFPVGGQVDHALSQWLVSKNCKSFRVAPRHMLFYSPKSEENMDSDIQTMAKLEDLYSDPEWCQRYMGFLGSAGPDTSVS